MDRTHTLRLLKVPDDAATPLGRHVLLDMWEVPAADDAEALKAAILAAIGAMRATLLDLRLHKFEPQGITALAMLSESHLAVHTWPEQSYVAIDIFTCGETPVEYAIDALIGRLQPGRVQVRTVPRGTLTGNDGPPPIRPR